MRARRIAAGLCLVLAIVVWNVRFDAGVAAAVRHYLAARAAFLSGEGPRVEMAAVMRDGAAASAPRATLTAAPLVVAALVLARRRRPGPKA
jgi:hypothetical protein